MLHLCASLFQVVELLLMVELLFAEREELLCRRDRHHEHAAACLVNPGKKPAKDVLKRCRPPQSSRRLHRMTMAADAVFFAPTRYS